MKKNILGAIVIFFITFACLLVINELTSENTSQEIDQYYSDIE